MALSLYDNTIPIFIKNLTITSAILTKARTHAEAHGIPLSQLVEGRLAPDMNPLSFQIQTMSNVSKAVPVRLAQTEAVPMDDNETTFEELQARIAKTIAALKKVEPGALEGKLDAEVTIQGRSRTVHYSGKEYVLSWALPNFFFHQTTAYDILRHLGVPLSKLDFLGAS